MKKCENEDSLKKKKNITYINKMNTKMCGSGFICIEFGYFPIMLGSSSA